MNKRQIIASLNKIANELDNTGLHREATSLTNVMRKIADKPLFMEDDEPMFGKGEFFPDEEMTPKSPKPQLSGGGAGQPPKPPFFDNFEEDEDYPNRNLTNRLDEISSMMDMHGNHPADKLREDYSKDYNNPTYPEMKDVFRDLDELVVENMTMNREQRKRYEEIKKQIMNAF